MSARIVARLAVEPAHDAEIDDRRSRRRRRRTYCRVQVGVEEAVAEHLLEERVGGVRSSTSAIEWPAAISAARSSTRMPLTRSVVSTVRPVRAPIDPRHAKARIAGEILGAARTRRPPRSANPSRARTDCASVCTTSTGFSRRSAGRVRSSSRASQRNRSRSRAKAAAIPGRNTLTATSSPSVVVGEMDLRDRGRGDRRVVERREQGGERPAELGLDQRAAPPLPGTAAGGPAAAPDPSAISSPSEIGAGRQQLAELDEARPQLA